MAGGETNSLTVNGKSMESGAETLASLLAELSLSDAAIVAEVNGVIVPPAGYASTPLGNGDCIELVRFVGGG